MNFEIFYGDGSILRGSSLQDWYRFPNENVQVVVQLHADNRREKLLGWDYYTLTNGTTVVGQNDSSKGYTKFGRTMSDIGWAGLRASLESNSLIWNKL